jgi:hypothetical protein
MGDSLRVHFEIPGEVEGTILREFRLDAQKLLRLMN